MKNKLDSGTIIRLAHLGRSASATTAGLGTALTTIPAFAASWQTAFADLDWRSYLDWHTYTGWSGALLAASIALLIVALLIRATRDSRTDRTYESKRVPVRNDLFLRRIGTMPIEPPESLEAAR